MRIEKKTTEFFNFKKFMRDTRAPYGHDKYDIYLSRSKSDIDK